MTFNQFVDAAIAYARRHPEQRFGQACMNALRWNRPSLFGRVGLDIWECTKSDDAAIFAWFYELEQMW